MRGEAAVVVGALALGWWLGLPPGVVLLLLLLWDRKRIETWNKTLPVASQEDTQRADVALTPLRLQVIADTARQVETSQDITMFRFLASCQKISYETLRALMLVDVDPKLLKKQTDVGNQDFLRVRRDFLRNMGKKLTHPLFGITPSTSEEKYRGCEIVEWLASNFSLQRSHAVEVGHAMQQAGFLVPLKRLYKAAPGKRVQFGDKMRHWKFDLAAIDKDWPAERYAIRTKHNRASLRADDLAAPGGPLASSATMAEAPSLPLPPPPPSVLDAGKEFGSESALMGPREWQYLFAAGTTETFPEGREILSAGCANDNLYRLTKGTVKVVEVDKRKKLLSDEGVFGEESVTYLNGTSTCSLSVTAVTAATVQVVDGATLCKLLKIEPVVCKAFFRWLAASLSSTSAALPKMAQEGARCLFLGGFSLTPPVQLLCILLGRCAWCRFADSTLQTPKAPRRAWPCIFQSGIQPRAPLSPPAPWPRSCCRARAQ